MKACLLEELKRAATLKSGKFGLRRPWCGILVLAALSGSVRAQASVSLAWDPSPDPSVVGYHLYQGGATRAYTNVVDVGNTTNATLSGLRSGATYFFAATAVNGSGLESDFSNEVSYSVPTSNAVPAVVLTSPSGGANFTAPATIGCTASVTANGHTITQVQFYNGATLLGQAASAPYTFTWSSVAAGSYSLTARLVYDTTNTLNSAAANVTVVNPAPAIALTAPTNGASFTAPATISCAATVTANGHTITQVQFYNGATLLGQAASAPYSFTWSNVAAGAYALSAVAVYDSGSTVSSSPAGITVGTLPAPWQAADIGKPGMHGTASASGGLYTVTGAGNISGAADNFCFLYQPLSADGEIRARLSSAQTAASGCAGVMVRESLTTGSRYAFMGITSGGTFRWQRRSSTGGSTSSATSGTGSAPNAWLRLVRTGSTLYGYKSANGTKWTQVSSRSITMATNIYFGLAVSSGSTNALNTAAFTNLTVIP